jgi:hypothetical protein
MPAAVKKGLRAGACLIAVSFTGTSKKKLQRKDGYFMQGFSARRFVLGLCFLCLLLPQVCPVKAQAAESASQTDIIFAEMNALTDGGELPFDKAGALGQRAVEALSPETLWRFGFDAFAKALRESFAVFPLLVAVILLSCVIGIYSENLGGGSRLAEFACLLGI